MEDDRVDEIVMDEVVEHAERRVPFREHPLFVDVERQLADGQDVDAAENLKKLAVLYPEEETIRDLEVRVALRSTFSVADSIPVPHRQPGAVLRTLLIFLVLIAGCLTAAAGFGFAYERWVRPASVMREQEIYVARLVRSVELRLTALDIVGAREALDELAIAAPESQDLEAARLVLAELESRMQVYEAALQREEEGDREGALELLRQLQQTSPEFKEKEVRAHMARIEKAVELERKWEEAQHLVAAGDLEAALPLLTAIQLSSPGFQRNDVNTHLFNAYTFLATQRLDEARGDVGQVKEAIRYLDLALELQPTRRDLGEERRLARQYVAGAAAYAEEQWIQVVKSWQPVHRARPDYQGGVVDTYLYQAYPRAAADLLAEAGGEARPLRQAVEYLDQLPDDAWAREERSLAIEYLAGLEAFNAARWDEAIVHWGPIYVVRPSYQGGVLEERLAIACAATEVEFSWCSP
jgi:tetratricopeptide (TPR) repeat protein